ncbi:hypothetical protein UFOVP787_22 [uncultured Caudovirales phage]|uniref:Uncharacterized protein n=1 Tax=uncultured Caudovirales phage TaxID=2100421 RepID=A0A6J5NX90_9CAUD|nr:hypothetical protein UFOVP787_22 [uncultured Caudovirales phage]
MNNEPLTDKNFLLFCAHHYENSMYSTTEDFIEDMNRLKYIKKLITRYIENGDLKERLILNHIIILNNCFGPEVLCKILYLKLKNQMKYVKPFLVLLNIMPDKILNVGEEKIIYTDIIEMDTVIVEKLRKV